MSYKQYVKIKLKVRREVKRSGIIAFLGLFDDPLFLRLFWFLCSFRNINLLSC